MYELLNSLIWNDLLISNDAKILCFSDGSNYVRSSMFNRSKQKIVFSSLITKRWKCPSRLDDRKNDLWVFLMSNLVNLVMGLLSSMFNVPSFQVENKVL